MRIAEATIDYDRLPVVRAEIVKLNRRARRLGAAPFALDSGPPRAESYRDARTDALRRREVCDVTLSGEAIMVAGWRLLARVDHLAGDDGVALPFVSKAPGCDRDLSALDPAALVSRCDHCRTTRRRSAVYLLASTSGDDRTIVVGSTCLADFTGSGRSPDAILALAFAAIALLGSEDGEGGGGGGRAWCDPLVDYLQVVAATIRAFGWLSRGEANATMREGGATADLAMRWSTSAYSRAAMREIQPSRSDRALALLAVRWAARMDPRSDYESNAHAVARAGYVVARTAGVAASIVAVYQRERERLRRAARVNPDAIAGTVGKRETFTATVLGLAAFDGDYGTRHRVSLVDHATGATIVWWASSRVPTEVRAGVVVRFKATVKKHDTYRGTRQTVVTRLAVVADADEEVSTAA